MNLVVLEKKIFKVFTIQGHGGRLGHVTLTKCIKFIPFFAWRLHINFIQIALVLSEKKSFENVDREQTNEFKSRSLNDLDLQSFIRVEYKCIFTSESTQQFKTHFSVLPIREFKEPNLTLQKIGLPKVTI